ncbi:MAG: 16S rRNA processing protein RimM [Desulfuromonadaceae bacterium]|nr:16S rRNA processing protein RimM [Desulfuromonadaceae bacterium]
MAESAGGLLWAGKIVAPHGLKGGLKVRTSPDRFPLLENCRRLVLRHADGRLDPRQVMLAAAGKKGFFLRLRDVEEIDEAEKLCGCDILIDPAEIPEDPRDDRYPFKLIGLSVVDGRLGDLGTVEDFFTTAAHGILVVEGRFGEVLIPAIGRFLTEIDRERGIIVADLPEGLVATE